MELNKVIDEKEYLEELNIIDKRIEETYKQVYAYSNPKLIMLYYDIGRYINKHKIWGSEYVKRLSNDLKHRKGMSYPNLYRMSQLVENFTMDEIVSQAVIQIPWGHIVTIMSKCETKESRLWYINKTYENSWSRSSLIKQIKAKAYERNKIEPIVSKGIKEYDNELIEEIVKANYYLPIKSNEINNEKELKEQMMNKLIELLQEVGKGNAFVGREYKIKGGKKTFYIDLLFYNYLLHSFLVIEVKIGEYKSEYYGQLKNYVLLVDKELKTDRDDKTIGVLICRDGDRNIIKTTFDNDNVPLVFSRYVLEDNLMSTLKSKKRVSF